MFKNKTFIFIIVIIGIVSMIILGGILLTSDRGQEEEPVTNADFLDIDFREDGSAVVNSKSFTESSGLEFVSQGPIKTDSDVLFIGNQVGFINSNRQFQIGEQVLVEDRLNVDYLYNTQDGFILGHTNSPRVLTVTNDYVTLPNNVHSIVPFQDRYIYVEYDPASEDLIIKETNNISIGNEQLELARITPSGPAKFIELRVISGLPYLLIFDDFDKENIEIWQLDNGNVRKIRDLEDVQVFEVFSNGILFTDELEVATNLTPFKTNLLDLRDPERPFIQELPFTQVLGSNNVFGTVLANRCTFDDISKIYCVVKQNNVDPSVFQFRDILFSYDTTDNSIDFPYPSLVFSADDVYLNEGDIYITSQETLELYRFK